MRTAFRLYVRSMVDMYKTASCLEGRISVHVYVLAEAETASK